MTWDAANSLRTIFFHLPKKKMDSKTGMERKLNIDIYFPYLLNTGGYKYMDTNISVNKEA